MKSKIQLPRQPPLQMSVTHLKSPTPRLPKILNMQCIRLEFLPNSCNKFSLVAMATCLENLGDEFEIANHENTTIAAKMKIWCIWSELWPILCIFGYDIQKSVAVTTSLVNFRKVSENTDTTSRCKNIEYAVHTTGVFTKFM